MGGRADDSATASSGMVIGAKARTAVPSPGPTDSGQEEAIDEVNALGMGPSTDPVLGVAGSDSIEVEAMDSFHYPPSGFPKAPDLWTEDVDLEAPKVVAPGGACCRRSRLRSRQEMKLQG
ncbi:hypothetical protein PVAP13_1NG172000 [Panicum virgatum]|uniref:Uncharacterized protein n=1 Tax=Panicum virgatum TaxID=38727 RepID=A0A8T0WVY0_PANVG|nr:hypothetical protein PVAP13_1NG172000 [Panicum virgatum]